MLLSFESIETKIRKYPKLNISSIARMTWISPELAPASFLKALQYSNESRRSNCLLIKDLRNAHQFH